MREAEVRRLGPRLEDEEDLVQQDERGPEREAHHERRARWTRASPRPRRARQKRDAGEALPDDDAREQDRAQPGRHADLGRAGRDERQVPGDPGPVRRQEANGPEAGRSGSERVTMREVEAPESQEHGREQPEIEPGHADLVSPRGSRGPWASSSARLYAGPGRRERWPRPPVAADARGWAISERWVSASEPVPGWVHEA